MENVKNNVRTTRIRFRLTLVMRQLWNDPTVGHQAGGLSLVNASTYHRCASID